MRVITSQGARVRVWEGRVFPYVCLYAFTLPPPIPPPLPNHQCMTQPNTPLTDRPTDHAMPPPPYPVLGEGYQRAKELVLGCAGQRGRGIFDMSAGNGRHKDPFPASPSGKWQERRR